MLSAALSEDPSFLSLHCCMSRSFVVRQMDGAAKMQTDETAAKLAVQVQLPTESDIDAAYTP
jgi:hypothetical protein